MLSLPVLYIYYLKNIVGFSVAIYLKIFRLVSNFVKIRLALTSLKSFLKYLGYYIIFTCTKLRKSVLNCQIVKSLK